MKICNFLFKDCNFLFGTHFFHIENSNRNTQINTELYITVNAYGTVMFNGRQKTAVDNIGFNNIVCRRKS